MLKVDEYIQKKTEWSEALQLLRKILQETELIEDYKWKVPTYTHNGKNVIGMAGFKNYVGLWFFQGVFLTDKHKLLVNAQESKTKGLRQLRYSSYDEIDTDILRSYIEEAIQNQKDGKEIKNQRTKEVILPKELISIFEQNKDLAKAFKQLTLGKQKDYAEYIATAKQEKTKKSRIEKISPMILNGIGLNDKYKNC